jgi:3-oxoadipate enol-lactonase
VAQLVFLHGAGDTAAVWERQTPHFSPTHDILLAELPGRGARLAEPPVEGIAQAADDVLAQIQRRGFDRPVLVGHSMGGAVVLTAALARLSLPRALVLVSSGARLRMHPSFLEASRQQAERLPPRARTGPLIPFAWLLAPGASPETRAWLQAHGGQATAGATDADFRATNLFDATQRLGELTQRVLVIAGQQDRMTPPTYQMALAEGLPHAELVLVDGAGHYVQAEQADAFNAALEAFLDKLVG